MRKNERRTPIQERAQATVDAVIEAAAQILVEDGYAKLSTNRVARRAGVSVGTLYQYFPHKEAIVEGLVHRIAEERIGTFETVLTTLASSDLPLEEGLRLLLEATLASMRVRPELSRRLILEAPRGGRIDLENEWRRRCIDFVRAVFYRRRDRLREGADVELMAYVVITASFAVLQDAVAHRPELLEGSVLREEMTRLCAGYLGGP